MFECDQCRRRVEGERAAMTWLSIDRVGIPFSRMGDRPIEGVYCSPACAFDKLSGSVTGIYEDRLDKIVAVLRRYLPVERDIDAKVALREITLIMRESL